MSVVIYGIPNCDTMKKARAWLEENGVAHTFHDYKKQGVDRERLEAWVDELGWETVLNRAGLSFKKLPEDQRAGVDRGRAVDLMLFNPSMIKRPILDLGDRRLAGFQPEAYAAALRISG
ncbi:MAG: arsenate reductase [Brevundimonas sp.]